MNLRLEKLISLWISAPPLSVAYKNLPDVEQDQDFESGNATFRLEYDEGFNANWTVQCEQSDTRPAATVTWMIGNDFWYFSQST